MTIKKRLFISNILMLVIPVLVSVFTITVAMYLFANVLYKDYVDDAVYKSDISDMNSIIAGESVGLIESGYEEDKVTSFYEIVDRYVNLRTVKIEIHDDEDVVFSTSKTDISGNDEGLYESLLNIGGSGVVTLDETSLYGENIKVKDKQYTICIYAKQAFLEGRKNEIILRNIIIILCGLILISVFVTNRFLTKFVFKKIKEPLNELYYGLNRISEGDLDYRIEYNEQDEFKQICDDFNQMAEHLKLSEERTLKDYNSRKELIAGISHDLKTPLTSIKAYVEGLIEGVASTPQMKQKYMETILVKADDINKMVDKLFLFSKLDLGDYPFYPEAISLKREIGKIIDRYKKDFDKAGMTIEAEEITEDLKIYADPVQFESAVVNVIENSLKYKDGDGVNVKICCRDKEEYIDIIIDDDGPGVPDESLDKLFDVFYRGDPSRTNPNKGSGLGLAITAKSLEGQGGFVKAENLKPKGLRIIMTIPKEGVK